jgi:hypothetical protein
LFRYEEAERNIIFDLMMYKSRKTVSIGQNRSPNLQQQQQQKSNALILLGLQHSHHCMQAAMVVIV